MPRRYLPCLLAALTLVSATIFAQTPAAQPLRADEEMHRPGGIPDRVVLSWTGDPATTQTVTWRTDTTVKTGVAQIMPASDGSDVPTTVTEVKATTREFVTKFWTVNYHAAEFTGLKPDTLYCYRVGSGSNWSEWIHFRTASSKPAPFSFIYFGDVQGGVRVMWPRVLREAFKAAPDAKFIAFAGDLIEDAPNERYWGEFFTAGSWYYSMIPLIAAPGNHDYRGPSLDTNWRAQFTLPENGPEGLKEYTYYTDIQGLRIITLNTMDKVPEQTKWLETVLANNPNKWTVAVFHYPIFATTKDGDTTSIREQWKPIFDKYKVDLVLTGHFHNYARSGLVNNTVYVVSVGGSKQYPLFRQDWMRRAADQTQFFQVIHIDGDKLSYESRTATGTLYDAFELSKQPGKPNKFVEKIPAGVPEMIHKAPAGK